MSVNACPIATLKAPMEKVWRFLSVPENYALWWDAVTRSIVPDVPAQPGQFIHAETRALGRWWKVTLRVEKVDPLKHQIQLDASLPFGITVHNLITCIALTPFSCRVSFG